MSRILVSHAGYKSFDGNIVVPWHIALGIGYLLMVARK